MCYDDLSEVEAEVICRELDLPTDGNTIHMQVQHVI